MTAIAEPRPRRLTRGAGSLACAAAILWAASACRAEQADPGADLDLVLRYDRPAADWETQALPIGNGRMGAMLFGGLALDRVAFNEISLWTGNEDVMGAYQAFGNLNIALPGHDSQATEYFRELDLSLGEGRLTYRRGGVTYRRQVLASHPAQVIVVRLTADGPGSYTGEVELADMHNARTVAEGNRMTCSGALTLAMTPQPRTGRGGGAAQPRQDPNRPAVKTMDYESQVRVLNEGGSLAVKGSRIAFSGCDSLTILLGAGTSHILDYDGKFQGEHPHTRLTAQMEAASAKPFRQLREEHIRDYLSLFGRVRLDLGRTSEARRGLATDNRLEVYNKEGKDPGLEALLFQYGRYLLMSCSRDTLPANLQGLWNDRNNPPWNSDYHTNINIQMNYWPAEPANLGECHLRLFEMIRALRVPYQKATAAQFPLPDGRSARGWTVRTESNPFGNMSYVWNMGGSAWYCQHLWEHYAFTQDRDYLATVAYPVMKEICEFWEDHLKALPDGRLVVPNGWSPEHGPRDVDGVTYYQMIVWDLFTNFIEAADALGADRDYRDKVAALRGRLVGPKVGRWGQLQEWMEDLDDPNDQHRHTSHLFGVYPGRQISTTHTPDLAKAAAVSLAARGEAGDSRRSWTWPWRCALWARLGRPEDAYRMVRGLFAHNLLPNLLANHPPMQMDGNFGFTAGVCEMLLQSRAIGSESQISDLKFEMELLPALPGAWPAGSVTGLRARGGFVVDMAWSRGRMTRAALRSIGGQRCRVRYGDKVADLALGPGRSCVLDGNLRQNP